MAHHDDYEYYSIARKWAGLINDDKMNFMETMHLYSQILNSTVSVGGHNKLDLEKLLSIVQQKYKTIIPNVLNTQCNDETSRYLL